jgi:hypothetical protein
MRDAAVPKPIYTKWALAVKTNIADSAILPDKASSNCQENNFTTREEITNTPGNTIRGFLI